MKLLCRSIGVVLLTAGCAAPQGQPQTLAGTSWRLVRFEGSDDTVLKPDDPSKYTIELGADGQVAARALFKGGIYDRSQRRFVPIARLMSEIGVSSESPPPSPEIEAFLKADDELKRAQAERA